jgi:hypothetical protein
MKNLKTTLCSLLLLTVFMGQAQKKKVAVVTFYANKLVKFDKLGGGLDFIIKDIIGMRDDPRFNLTPILEKYHTNFFNEYAKEFPFDLVPEKEVVDTEKYKAFEPKFELKDYEAANYLMQGNYKYIYEGMSGKYNEEGMTKLFADQADGVLFVNVDFAFEQGFGLGKTMTIKMRATTRIALYNKTGEKVFAFSEGENSKKTGVMIGGVPVINADKILPMCESALEELMGDLKKRIAKIVKKSEMKL